MPRPPLNFAGGLRSLASPFTLEAASHLAVIARAQLPCDAEALLEALEQLRANLNRASRFFQATAAEPRPSARARRERLSLILKEAARVRRGELARAPGLARLLARAPGALPGLAAGVEHCFDRPLEEDGAAAVFTVHFTPDELDRVLRETRSALRPATGRAGPVGDPALRMLVAELATIWSELTGRRPTKTTRSDRDGDQVEGAFPRFLQEAARQLGVTATGNALWKRHERSARARRAAEK